MDKDIDYKHYEGFASNGSDLTPLFDSQNRMKTKMLFLESFDKEFYDKGESPIYTLRNRTYKGLPSAYQIYMHSVDEYDAAIKLVGSMAHWRRLIQAPWFLNGTQIYGHEGLVTWRADKKAADESFAKNILRKEAAKGNVNAAKALTTPEPRTVPSKRIEKLEKEKEVIDQVRELDLDFMKRDFDIIKGTTQ